MSGIEVVPYNPEWKHWFKEIKDTLWIHVHDLVVDIDHVGSTSVEGMSTKPIIDIDIVLDDWAKFPRLVERLASLGYVHVGDLGIRGREAFNHESKPKHPHHLYACHKDSVAYRNHVLLRKHLMENPVDFQRYIDLKICLAESAQSREDYWCSKTLLILEFLGKEGVSSEEIERIRRENLG